MTPVEAAEWIASRAALWRAEQGVDWAIVESGAALGPGTVVQTGAVIQTGAVVGRMAVKHLDMLEGAGGAAYWVLPAARGRGIAARALVTMTNWLFDDVGLHRLTLLHSAVNTGSCRVADKAGFTVEGTALSSVRHVDGWHDMHVHAKVNADPSQRA